MSRCLLFSLNHDIRLVNATFWFVMLVASAALPPNCSDFTPLVPSANVELTRTDPLGISRYGVLAASDPLSPTVVSLRMPIPK